MRNRRAACAPKETRVQRLSVKDLGNKPSYEGDFQFVGVDDNYFMTAAFAPGSTQGHVSVDLDLSPAGLQRVRKRDLGRLLDRAKPPGHAHQVLRRSEGLRRSGRRSIATWCGRSTSACSQFWSSRFCVRSNGSTATSATTAGRSSS